MTKQTVDNEEELVLFKGPIEFKKYQWEAMEVMAKSEKYHDTEEWIHNTILDYLWSELEELQPNYANPIIQRLIADRHLHDNGD